MGLIDFGRSQKSVWFGRPLPLSSGCLVVAPHWGHTAHGCFWKGGGWCPLREPSGAAASVTTSGVQDAANTPGARVVSPLLPERSSYGGPVPPTMASCLSGSPGIFPCSPSRECHTSASSGSDLGSAPSSLLASLPVRDLPGTVSPSWLPPRGAGPIPLPFSRFSFPARLYGDFLASSKSEVFPSAFSRCSVRTVP